MNSIWTDSLATSAFNNELAAQDVGISAFICAVILLTWYVRYLHLRTTSQRLRIATRWFGLVGVWGLLLVGALQSPTALVAAPVVAAVGTLLSQPAHKSRIHDMVYILALALGLRLPLMNVSLWYDEIFSASIAQLSLPNLFVASLGDVHPPLYNFILHWFLLISHAEWVVRLPSLMFGLGSIWLVYEVVRAHYGNDTGEFAALIFTVLPGHIYYSTEARSYSMLLFFVLLVIHLHNRDRQIAALAALAGVALSHNVGYIFAVVMGLYILWTLRGQQRWFNTTMYAAPVLAFPVAWMVGINVQLGHLQTNGWWLREVFNPAMLLPPLLHNTMHENVDPAFTLVVSLVLIVVLALALYEQQRSLKATPGWWYAVAVGAPIAVAVASIVVRNVYLHRALLPAFLLLFTVPVARWLSRFPASDKPLWITLITVAMIATPTASASNDLRMDWRTMVPQGCNGADVIYTTNSQMQMIALWYSDLPVVTWTGSSSYQMQTIADEYRFAFAWDTRDVETLRGQRVCTIYSTGPYTDPRENNYLYQNVISRASSEVILQESHWQKIISLQYEVN